MKPSSFNPLLTDLASRPRWPHIPPSARDTAELGVWNVGPRASPASQPKVQIRPDPFHPQTEPAHLLICSRRPDHVGSDDAWLSCLAASGEEAHRLFQPSSRPLRRTKIKLLGYARLGTLDREERKAEVRRRRTPCLERPCC